ncbi:MAG: dipeptide ABC transporter permease DppC [Candidatus Liberibacter europaeus]|uniref:Dipeptide ABC transporter permease DppC n=1 Tax=Candidatus Liberibacter europaeus TaxID=744859 RepID=A0A2T4VWE3_9HYPH|nr:dipeptide ABC transporter permease DppC [Candidatus Liberibacter europaeus]PTL86098.1 MAG: dipeptide ABC transporter permease DppC [Candidatus Liberibacter europaeus]
MSKPLSPLQEFWYCFSYNKASIFGMVYIIIMVFVALFADLIAYHSPIEQFRQFLLIPPIWQEGGNWQFVLGTDDLGRDILSRLIYATRISLFVGSLVVLISLIIGVSIGLFSGYVGGLVDVFIMRIVDIMLAIPALLQALVLVVIFGFSIFSMSFILSFTALPGYIRLTRARVLLEIKREYVVASQVVGSSALRQMFINILPNCFDSLIVQASLGFSGAILNMAALGFLGMGVQPPTPEWGNMLSDVLQFTQTAWWLVTFPGLAILLTVLSLNLIGDGLRDALDPKTKSL